MTDIKILPDKPVDVFIVGGGLAGLSLALQIKQARPETSIVVAEKRQHPVPKAAFKVGESTVEGAGYYFSEVLGLKEYLEQEHLFKYGFRYFFAEGNNEDITKRFELASIPYYFENHPPHTRTYQLDRGKFENKLGEELCRHGVIFLHDCQVHTLTLNSADSHTCRIMLGDGSECIVTARWVVDASGRAGFLKRQLNLTEKVEHDVNAAWFRMNKIITVQDWNDDPKWQARFDPRLRRLATNHLMGQGYWVWLIPLADDLTSVGIVADNSLHPFNQINRRERALSWLKKHEPQCAQEVAKSEMLDFMVLKHYAHSCKQVFSSNRWAITGVAGVFTDPLHSLGSDLITVSNTMITDMILRELDGEDIGDRVDFMNRFYLDFMYKILLLNVQNQYPLFDNSFVYMAKELWTAVWYFTIVFPLIYNHKLTDCEYLSSIEEDLSRFYKLHSRVQAFFHELYIQGPDKCRKSHKVYTYLTCFYGLVNPEKLSDGQLKKRLVEQLSILENVAASMFQQIETPPEFMDVLPQNLDTNMITELKRFWRSLT